MACLQRYQRSESWNLESKKKGDVQFTSMEILGTRNFCFKQFVRSFSSLSTELTGWCYQFGLTNEEKERVNIPLKNWVASMMEPEEVDMLVSPSNTALGNRMQGNASFSNQRTRLVL